MPLADIHTRDAVFAAIAEYDEFGPGAFLAKYGFGPARSYFLVYQGRRYDSKAIIGAAHSYALPSLGPLRSSDFSGDENTVARKLEQLGFEIERREGPPNPEVLAELVRNERAARLAKWAQLQARGGPQGVAPATLRELGIYGGQQGVWVDKARTSTLAADGVGVTVSVLHTGSAYADDLSVSGMLYHYPQTRRPAGRDAAEIAATKAAGDLQLPIFVITYPHMDADSRDLSLGWVEGWDDAAKLFLISFGDQPPAQLNTQVDDVTPFTLVAAAQNARRTTTTARSDQQRFKFQVFQRYSAACAVCGIEVQEVLQEAHIRSKQARGSDDPRNGLVFCASHHSAFDTELFAIEPNTLAIRYRSAGPDAIVLRILYTSLAHLPRKPHSDALEWHWQRWTERYTKTQ